MRPQFLAFVIFLTTFSASCSTQNSNLQNTNETANSNQSAENTNSIKDNAEGLAMVIKLPFEPEDAVWREEKLGRQSENSRVAPPSLGERKLTAVLQFKAEDAEKIAIQAQTYKQPVPAEIGAENWFPAELIAQSQLSGDETLKGATYAANDFFQTPYLDGRITRVQDSNYFILELFSK